MERQVMDVGLRGMPASTYCVIGKYPTLSIGIWPDDFGVFCICPGWGAVVDFGQKWRKVGDLEDVTQLFLFRLSSGGAVGPGRRGDAGKAIESFARLAGQARGISSL